MKEEIYDKIYFEVLRSVTNQVCSKGNVEETLTKTVEQKLQEYTKAYLDNKPNLIEVTPTGIGKGIVEKVYDLLKGGTFGEARECINTLKRSISDIPVMDSTPIAFVNINYK